MGLFDSIASNLLGGALGGQNSGVLGAIIGQVLSGQHGDLGSMLGGMLNQAGGLPGLMQKAQQMGMGDIVASWVSPGKNESINHDQLTGLLGQDAIQGVASKFGVSSSELTPLIASVLPQLVDKLTPEGSVNPELHQGDALNEQINGLLKGGGMTGLLGGLLGGRS